MWQAGTSRGVDSKETNHARADDVILSRSRNKLKTSLLPKCYQTLKNGNLP